jgi:hypothetical protein
MPAGTDENHKYLSQASSFPAEISAGLLLFYKSKCYDRAIMSGPTVRWLSYYWPCQFTAAIVIVIVIVIYFTFQRSMIGNRTFR